MYESSRLLSVVRNAQESGQEDKGQNFRKSNMSELQSKSTGAKYASGKSLLSQMVSYLFGQAVQGPRKEEDSRQGKIGAFISKISGRQNASVRNLWLYARSCMSDGLGSYRWSSFQRRSKELTVTLCELSPIKNLEKRRLFNFSFSKFQLVRSQGANSISPLFTYI
jgi:hypothetical protein